jgi:hypothetical protein
MFLWIAFSTLVGSIVALAVWPVNAILMEILAPVIAGALFIAICAVEARQ